MLCQNALSTKICFLFIFSFSICVIFTTLQFVYAGDVIKLAKPHHDQDPRLAYPLELLKAALSKTEANYGPYQIEFTLKMDRDRALRQLIAGEISIHDAPTKAEWEEKALTVYIPIMKGLMGYRLFLVNSNRLEEFAEIQNIEQLKELKAGTGSQWSMTKSLENLGFKLVTGTSYLGLFAMLSLNRFDYFPRGINEVFSEYILHKPQFPKMVIEPTKAMYLPLPNYFFVSPKKPILANRIKEGLTAMLQDGSFDELFYHHFGNAIRKANLRERQVFFLKNPQLPPHSIYNKSEFWFLPSDMK